MHVLSIALNWLLVAIFAGAGIMHLRGPKTLRDAYERFNYPIAYRFAVGFLNLSAAFFLAGPLRMFGVVLAFILLFFAIVTLLDHKEYGRALSRFGVLGALWLQVLAASA
jgi:hypothetical protein